MQVAATAAERPRLSFWKVCCLSLGFFGIQIGYALQAANSSRILQSLGATLAALPLLWIAAPLTGLVIQPLVGHFSDRTWTFIGRRRPFIVAGSVLTAFALVSLPRTHRLWIAVIALWLLDISLNTATEPFRAYVADMLPSEQRPLGYAMQGVFISAGAVIASVLPYLMVNAFAVSNLASLGEVPPSVRYSFYGGAAVLVAAVLATMLTTREYPPSVLAGFACFGTREPISSQSPPCHSRIRSNFLTDIVTDLISMPRQMRRLAVVQFFSWAALFMMWIYATPAVAQRQFGAHDAVSTAYNVGANWVGILFGGYNLVAAIYAFALPPITRAIGIGRTHIGNLLVGAVGLISFFYITDPRVLLLAMICVGMAWASILTLPYTILSDAIPQEKMGVYMGLFNIFIVLPQLLVAGGLSSLLREFFSGEPIFAFILGGSCWVAAALAMLFVAPRHPATFQQIF